MDCRVVVFAHSDGDGHVSAVQSIRNLKKDNYRVSDVVVDPKRTRGSTFWTNAFSRYDLTHVDMVVVLDIMIDRTTPSKSLQAIREVAIENKTKKFLIIDHHPIDSECDLPANVDLKIVDTVFDCCYGKPSDLMILAAICDKDEGGIPHEVGPDHRSIAKGISRSVTDIDGLAGPPTLYLIHNERWEVFKQLAKEPNRAHRTFYGNRVSCDEESPILSAARAVRACANDTQPFYITQEETVK